MSERPKNGADPDATVMIPAGAVRPQSPDADPDSTVMIPAGRSPQAEPDSDATVMIPAGALAPKGEPDGDATVMIPAGGLSARNEPDSDATVMIPAGGLKESVPDPDSTVMIPAADLAALASPPAPPAAPVLRGEPDPDATIAIPSPGRRRDAAAPAIQRAAAAPVPEASSLGGLNPLLAAANPILAVVAQIRHALRHPDPAGLRASLDAGIDAFERDAAAAGFDAVVVATASLALCALLDESAASTPWGAAWVGNGLVAARHGTDAPDVFDELERLTDHPGENLVLLEFHYACLALGFEGRYRDVTGGRDQLAVIRLKLRELLRTQHPWHDGELSARWRGLDAPARAPAGLLRLWVAAAGAALLLALLYLGYSVSLGALSDPVARQIAQLRAPEFKPPAASAPAPVASIAALLAEEIARGEVAVTDAPGRSTIVIRGDQLFASGSTRIEAAFEPVVQRIAAALDKVPGAIVVAGHTDDVPIRTARFPSNWELSAARAASVVKQMAPQLKAPARLRGEGLADSAPLAPNDSAANRARNRRVTIVLRTAQ